MDVYKGVKDIYIDRAANAAGRQDLLQDLQKTKTASHTRRLRMKQAETVGNAQKSQSSWDPCKGQVPQCSRQEIGDFSITEDQELGKAHSAADEEMGESSSAEDQAGNPKTRSPFQMAANNKPTTGHHLCS